MAGCPASSCDSAIFRSSFSSETGHERDSNDFWDAHASDLCNIDQQFRPAFRANDQGDCCRPFHSSCFRDNLLRDSVFSQWMDVIGQVGKCLHCHTFGHMVRYCDRLPPRRRASGASGQARRVSSRASGQVVGQTAQASSGFALEEDDWQRIGCRGKVERQVYVCR